MTVAYKLLNPNLTTYGGYQWVPGTWHHTSGEGDLCGPGWFHAYEHAEIAHFLNPIHANFKTPVLWTVSVEGKQKRDGQLKCGWTKMRLIAPHLFNAPTIEQRVRFAIACGLSVYTDQSYRAWAKLWIDGTDRSYTAAEAAAEEAAEAEAAKAAEAAAEAAAKAAEAAAKAAAKAAWAAKKKPFSLVECAHWALSNSLTLPQGGA